MIDNQLIILNIECVFILIYAINVGKSINFSQFIFFWNCKTGLYLVFMLFYAINCSLLE